MKNFTAEGNDTVRGSSARTNVTNHTMEVKVSVVIPTYNMARYLPHAIASVVGGNFEDVELLVVDDGSSDNTPQVMKRFTVPGGSAYDPRIRYLRKPNGGKSSAVNLALKKARGSFVTVLDADDALPQNSLSERYCKAIQEPKSELVIGGFEVHDEGGRTVGARAVPRTTSARSLCRMFWMAYKTPFHLNSCLISRELIKRTGPFDEQLQRCQDIDYSMRLLQEISSFSRTDAVVYRYRKHRGAVRRRMLIRLRTALRRPAVFWKNCHGFSKPIAVIAGFLLDVGKAAYELVGNYEA